MMPQQMSDDRRSWNFIHLFADEDGVSRVADTVTQKLKAVEFAPPAPPMFVSDSIAAQALVMIELPVGWQGGWHPSPRAQWVICLIGEMGYQSEDGTEFFLKPGSCILTTDTHGRRRYRILCGKIGRHIRSSFGGRGRYWTLVDTALILRCQVLSRRESQRKAVIHCPTTPAYY